MMSELKFQNKIMDEVKRSNRLAYAIKMSNRFLNGIPDLFIKHPDYPPMFIEAKLGKLNGNTNTVRIDTSVIQRKVLRDMERSGLVVAVWTLVQSGPNPFVIQSPWEKTEVKLSMYNSMFIGTGKGKAWDIEWLLGHPMGA